MNNTAAFFATILLFVSGCSAFSSPDLSGKTKHKNLTAFENPTVSGYSKACSPELLKADRFSKELSYALRMRFCSALSSVTRQLNETRWSEELDYELRQIWTVFTSQKVVIKPELVKFKN